MCEEIGNLGMDETSSQDALALLNSLELMVAFPLGPLLSAYETEQKVVDPPEDDVPVPNVRTDDVHKRDRGERVRHVM